LGRGGSSWVTMSVQNKALGIMPESPLDQLNLDLSSKAVLSFPHGNSKCEELVCCSLQPAAPGV
jgi:hypothetical protein